MATSARVERKRAARREGILQAAMEIVAAEGPAALTVQRLAKAVDVVPAALYRTFPGIGAVMVALQRQALDALGRRMDAALAAFDGGGLTPKQRALARLLVIARTFAAGRRARPAEHALIDGFLSVPSQMLGDDDARAVGASALPVLQRAVVLVRAAMEAGALDDALGAEQRTLLLFAHLHGLDHLPKLARFTPISERELLVAALGSFLRGAGARPADVEAALAATSSS